MKIVVKMITLVVVVFITSLAQVRGQTVTNTLPERLPIGDMQSVKDWVITNSFMKTSVFIQLMYQSSVDPTQWGGNFPWSQDLQFSSYGDYEHYLQTNGMAIINVFRKFTDIGSTIQIVAPIEVSFRGKFYYPLVVRADLGPIASITEASFLNLPQTNSGCVIPVKGLEYFDLRCGVPGVWPEQFWYTWNHGASTLSWGGPKDYVADTDVLLLNSRFLLATQRIRFTVVANGKTAVYTQHGDMLKPATVTRSGDRILINFPRGADVDIEATSDFRFWQSVTNIPWNFGTNFISFPIDKKVGQCFYKASVR